MKQSASEFNKMRLDLWLQKLYAVCAHVVAGQMHAITELQSWCVLRQAQMKVVAWYLAACCFIVGLLVVHVTVLHLHQDAHITSLKRSVQVQVYSHNYLRAEWQTITQGSMLWQQRAQWELSPPTIDDIHPLFETQTRVARNK